jgi:hypothetical protein
MAYISFVTCFALHFVYPIFLVVLGGIFGVAVMLVYPFGFVVCMLFLSVCYPYVGLFEDVSNFADSWAVECEDGPFFGVFVFWFICFGFLLQLPFQIRYELWGEVIIRYSEYCVPFYFPISRGEC